MATNKHKKLIIAFCLFVAVFLAYFESGNPEYGGDTRWAVHVAGSLLYSHNLNLDEYYQMTHFDTPPYGPKQPEVILVRTHGYNLFPYGVSLMETPLLWTLDLMPGHRMQKVLLHHDVTTKYQLFGASLFMALGVAVFFLIGVEITGDYKRSLLISLLYAFGSSAYSIGSRGLWMHGPTMLWLAVAVLGFLKAKQNTNWLWLSGFAVAFNFVVRPTNIVSCAVFSGYVLYSYRREAFKFFVMAGGVALLFFWFNHNQFGAWLPPYYHNRSDAFHNHHFLNAFFADAISPNRGILIFVPILLFVPLGWRILWKQSQIRDLMVAITAAILLHWIVIADTSGWWGGFSYGPRFFSDMTPLLFFFLLPISFVALNKALKVLFVVLALVSVFIHFRGANSKATQQWNIGPGPVPSRVWDWGDMQMFRGL